MSSAMNRRQPLSEPTLHRLPVYQRIAREMERRGTTTTDSKALARLSGATPATVRRDLSCLGTLGTRGSGYEISRLISAIDDALGLNRVYDVIVVGMGNLGRALVGSSNFLIRGARLVGVYDADPQVQGMEIAGLTVADPAQGLVPAQIGVMCVPADAAQDVANMLVEANIHAIVNFSPQVVTTPVGTTVRYVDFSMELQILVYHLINGTGPFGGGVLRTLGFTPPVPRPS